ncbi:hypothetical protein WEH80_05430 [Actinomycetes bacterium KLBMP 9759]
MASNTAGRSRPVIELFVQLALVGATWVVVNRITAGFGGVDVPQLGVLAFAAGVAATTLLGVTAWVTGDRMARRVAAAVGVYTGIALLLQALGAKAEGFQALGGSIAVLGVVGLLALAVRGSADRRRDRAAALGVLAAVAGGTGAATITALVAPQLVPPLPVVAAADLVAWSGAGAAGVVLLYVGAVADRPLLRHAGLAFATLSAANAVRIVDAATTPGLRSPLVAAMELGAVAMLLLAAVPFVVCSVRAVGSQREQSRTRLAAAEAGMAQRDLELRRLRQLLDRPA